MRLNPGNNPLATCNEAKVGSEFVGSQAALLCSRLFSKGKEGGGTLESTSSELD
jgi:hypothetical protein